MNLSNRGVSIYLFLFSLSFYLSLKISAALDLSELPNVCLWKTIYKVYKCDQIECLNSKYFVKCLHDCDYCRRYISILPDRKIIALAYPRSNTTACKIYKDTNISDCSISIKERQMGMKMQSIEEIPITKLKNKTQENENEVTRNSNTVFKNKQENIIAQEYIKRSFPYSKSDFEMIEKETKEITTKVKRRLQTAGDDFSWSFDDPFNDNQPVEAPIISDPSANTIDESSSSGILSPTITTTTTSSIPAESTLLPNETTFQVTTVTPNITKSSNPNETTTIPPNITAIDANISTNNSINTSFIPATTPILLTPLPTNSMHMPEPISSQSTTTKMPNNDTVSSPSTTIIPATTIVNQTTNSGSSTQSTTSSKSSLLTLWKIGAIAGGIAAFALLLVAAYYGYEYYQYHSYIRRTFVDVPEGGVPLLNTEATPI